MRVALHARVSTNKDQTTENQLIALRDWAKGRGHIVVGEYIDQGISGVKGRDKRPGLDEVMKAATLGQVDMVAITALDRLRRSLQHLITLVAELEALKVDLFVYNMALNTSTPVGQLMFNVMGSLAQFEREMIRERTLLGLERAKRQGKKLGRPKVSSVTERRIVDMLQSGVSVNKIMRINRVGASAVYRIKREMELCSAT